MNNIPTWEQFIRFVLQCLSKGDTLQVHELKDQVANIVGLTEEQRLKTLPSGQPVAENRIAWAISYLNRVDAIERPQRGQYRITPIGRDLLARHPGEITEKDLRQLAKPDDQWWVRKNSTGTFPPLKVQEEIVRILDSFTSLEAELETELETRQIQYVYYRNLIFKRQRPTSTVSLGEIADIKSGESISKKIIQSHPGKYPVINSGKKPLGFINSFNTDNNPIGITSRGANVGSITWCSGRYFRGNLNYSIEIRDSALLSTRYLYHLLQYLQPQIRQLCSYSGIPALNKTKLEELKIPLSNMNQQQQIASSLDQFRLMTRSSTIGLQAEIEARHKQYEYYRDRLLTFKELDHE